MTRWKAALGIGAACAACCAAPLLGSGTVLATGSAALVAASAALLACADELIPLAAALLGLAAMGLGAAWWRRRVQRSTQAPAACRWPTVAE